MNIIRFKKKQFQHYKSLFSFFYKLIYISLMQKYNLDTFLTNVLLVKLNM